MRELREDRILELPRSDHKQTYELLGVGGDEEFTVYLAPVGKTDLES